ncbi:hypothetical protein ATL40_1601 [Serinibacter salmoneus]|uniref:FHA domain-containing protein n=2 Tax=Serinibacter salmoneus TaxID=556530 RepID=A0A2A9CZZ1_9MICO|nr:hypothetical protein ATL40_1601 [Serinibacter salmoneus]
MGLQVEFSGEWHEVTPDEPFHIGRDGDLAVDDNPYLHRQFLRIVNTGEMWWLENIGSRLTATVADGAGSVQAWVAPGARLPLVFERTTIMFTAGPTTYEVVVVGEESSYTSTATTSDVGDTTIGSVPLTPSQKAMILAFAEPVLKGRIGSAEIPSSAQAAERLGWPLTKLNRKLDNVCDKLSRQGVRGLRGGPRRLAVNRRARLVEHAVATRLVVAEDLTMLDDPDQWSTEE